MRRRGVWTGACALAAAAALLLAAAGGKPAGGELWRLRNLGKAYFETPTMVTRAPAELKKALDLAPDSYRDRLNYGIALLRAGDLKAAIAELEKAQRQNPGEPHSWFNLGIAYKREGRFPDALRQFERMVQLAPGEPVSYYNLGLLYKLADRSAEALREFQASAGLDRNLVAPRYQIYNYYRLRNDPRAAGALAEFQRARQSGQDADDTPEMDWSVYAELFDPATARAPMTDDSPAPLWKFEPRALPGGADGLLVMDAGGDGKPDLLAWSPRGIRLYRNGSEPLAGSGLEDVKDTVAVAPGAGLLVIAQSGASLYRNDKGHFTRADAPIPAGKYRAAVWLDFDHDYDLDLFLLGAHPVLLRNLGAGRFEDWTAHFPFAPGQAIDGVAFRSVPDGKGIDLAVSYQDRAAILYRDRLRGVFEPEPLAAVPPQAAGLRAADLDNDGSIDLAFTSPGGVGLALNRGAAFEARGTPAAGAFALADLENRGILDIVAGNGISRGRGLAQFAAPVVPGGFPAHSSWVAADFDGDGATDLAGTGGLLLNRTAHGQWIGVALMGVKNPVAAEGAEVEVKAGEHYQKRIYEGVPLLFGLAGRKQVDTVRITWPNGMIQNQPEETAGRAVAYKEAPRLSGSCPMIFTWNGREFRFLTDVLGVAPLGASSGDGNYFPVDHDEYVRIPGSALVSRDGHYEVRITEELHEVSYIDQVRLIALDHPGGVDVYTNEKFKAPPFPEFRLYGVRRPVLPVTARDGRGRDLLPALSSRDGVYAAGFLHDVAGAAEMHSLTLDFGPAAALGNRAVLFLNGWVDWADGSTFLAASQSAPLTMPYLQVKDASGAWRTVIDDMGIPAGKPKTIAVDLSGKFLSASREVRIVTSLCVYWDQVFLGEDAAAPRVRMTPLDALAAGLRLRGFSRPAIDPARERPETFEYARAAAAAPWNQTPGMYTRYGDVRELLLAPDDRFAVLGAGDELQLRFPASALPALPPGWKRDFLLKVDGWAKDADANTAFSQSVEPLPFHAMSRYPYPNSERFPDDAAHRAWRERYNTRPAMRFVSPLVANRR